MKFMMFVATDVEPDRDPEQSGGIDAWFADVARAGQWVIGDRLRPVGDARTVRVRAGELLVSDGPFTEAQERIVGFDVLECVDIDEAVAIAARHPMARAGRLEVRAFWPLEG